MKDRLEDTYNVIEERQKRAQKLQETIAITEKEYIETHYDVLLRPSLSYLIFRLGKRLPTILKKASLAFKANGIRLKCILLYNCIHIGNFIYHLN